MTRMNKMAAAIVAIAAALCSCSKAQEESLYYGEDFAKYRLSAKPGVKLLDEVPAYTAEIVNDSLVVKVATELLFSDESHNPGDPDRLALPVITGIAPQYFDYTGEYKTARGDARFYQGETFEDGNFTVTPCDSVNVWVASNGNHSFTHTTTSRGYKVTWRRWNPDLERWIEFGPVEFKLETPTEKTSHRDVPGGIVYNAKTYGGVEYSSCVSASFEGVKGSASVTNLAYLLQHESKTTLEVTDYKVNIASGNLSLYRDPQSVDFTLTTVADGETTKESYTQDEAFNIKAGEAHDVEVSSKEAGLSTALNFQKQDNDPKASDEGLLNKTVYSFDDVVDAKDGNVIKVHGSFESYSWNSQELPYAEVISREASLTAVKNEAESTASMEVYDVKLVLTYKIRYNHSDKTVDTKTIVITWKRFRDIPDNPGEDVHFDSYTYEGEQVSMQEVQAKFNDNVYTIQPTNRGVAEGQATKLIRKQNMWAKFTLTEGKLPTDNTELSATWTQVGGVSTTTVTDSLASVKRYVYKFRIDIWNKTTEKVVAKGLLEIGWDDDQYRAEHRHAEIVWSKMTPYVEAAVKATSTASRKVAIDLPVITKGTALTKAAGESEEDQPTLTVADVYEEEVPDEIVGHKRDTLITARPDGKSFDVVLKSYDVYKRQGAKEYNSQSGIISGGVSGQNGTLRNVSNVDYVVTESGETFTANGQHNVPAVNGSENFNFIYNVTLGNKLVFEDKAGKVEIEGSIVISQGASFDKGNATTSGKYTKYDLKCGINAALKVLDNSLPLTATATQPVQIERQHSRDITYNKTSNGINMHIVSKWNGKEYKSGDIVVKSNMTADDGGELDVSSVDGFQTSGQTFSTKTSRDFNASATNGTDSFQPQFHLTVSVEGTYSDDEGTVTADYTAKVNGFKQNLGNTTNNGSTITRPYSCTANGNLTCGTEKLDMSATSNWTLSMSVPAEDIVPLYIIGASLTIVPAHQVGKSPAEHYEYGDKGQQRTHCLVLHCASSRTATTPEKSAAIVFGYEADPQDLPSDSEIQNANWLSGYTTKYNSGIDKGTNGKWEPAIGKYTTQYNIRGLWYKPLKGEELPCRDESLKQWGWSNFSINSSTLSLDFDKDSNTVTLKGKDGKVLKRFQ